MMDQSALMLRRTALLLLALMSGTDAAMSIIGKSDIAVGENQMLLCKAGADGDIIWRKDGTEITDNRVYFVDESTSKLEIRQAKLEDAGHYSCHCDFDTGNRDQTSTQIYVYEGPSFGTTEVSLEFWKGQDGVVACLASGKPSVDVSWLRDQKKIVFNGRTRAQGRWLRCEHVRLLQDNSLNIMNVSKDDAGKYVCQATIHGRPIQKMLEISVVYKEAPNVYVRAEKEVVLLGHNMSLSCNVSGDPYPQRYWINKQSGKILNSTSGRVHVEDFVLIIEEVVPTDGGLYSCMAVSTSGNASKDVAVHTQPGPSQDVSVSPEATSLVFSLKTPPVSGGTPITSFTLQWRLDSDERWKETVVPASDPLAITSLLPYTSYIARLAAMNTVGRGQFSDAHSVRTQGIREPDRPVLSSDKKKIDGNSLSIPVVQLDNGSSPLLHFSIRYRQEKLGATWKEETRSASDASITVSDLLFGADYHMEIMAVNAHGTSSPINLRFSVPQQAAANITKGGVVAIVMVIFLVLLIAVDATCCYTNHCGLLMFINERVFGRKFPGPKTMEEGDGTNGDLNLKGLDTPRDSVNQQLGVQKQTMEGRLNSEVTCDKAPLTKNE
ncbi:Neural cell adhesion molecule 1 [Merluccius polli]|uniref:Neural cell adhesion molecule 1 n=1 Tax=Merluccius polli TaxID=89951 RepID=A0AA47MXE0_MERPO|nr:Neural cell adhesion molecule 1 [Merluccius polli]